MNTTLIIIFIILISIGLITLLYISLYNKLLFYKIRIEEAEKLIIEELENRYNLIMSCRKTIEKNTKKEIDIFKELESVKNTNITPYEFEKKISKAINTIYIIKNDYPRLEEKKDFKNALIKFDESDTLFDAAKSFYNNHNSKLVSLIKTFPSNIVAIIHKIKIQPFYEGKEIFNESDDGLKI